MYNSIFVEVIAYFSFGNDCSRHDFKSCPFIISQQHRSQICSTVIIQGWQVGSSVYITPRPQVSATVSSRIQKTPSPHVAKISGFAAEFAGYV